MSERFNWKATGRVEGSYELKSRNILRTLQKDTPLNCLVCGEKPKRKDDCYLPSRTTSAHNDIIGHKACVDRICLEHTARSTADANAARLNAMNLIPLAGKKRGRPAGAKNRPAPTSNSDVLRQMEREAEIQKIKADAYAEALTRFKSILEHTGS